MLRSPRQQAGAARPVARGVPAPRPMPCAARPQRRGALQVVAFRTEKGTALVERAQRYCELVGSAATLGKAEVDSRLRDLVGTTGMTYLADGVVYVKDRYKNVGNIRDTLLRQHAVYRHDKYVPLTWAVNEEENTVFILVKYALTNVGRFQGREPSGATSVGWLIEKLGFDPNTQHIVSSLVTRQLTHEELALLVKGGPDTHAWQPADFYDTDIANTPPIVAGANDLKYMAEQLGKFGSVWNSSQSNVNILEHLLDPAAEYLDGYGGMHQDVGGGVVWRGIDGAKAAVARMLERYNTNSVLITHAVSDEKKLAFHHWRSNATLRDGSNTVVPLEGVALVLFNEHLQIRKVLEFTMREYHRLVRFADEDEDEAGVEQQS